MPEPEDETVPVLSHDPTGQVFVQPDDAAPEALEGEPDEGQRTSALRTATVVSGRLLLGIVVLAVIGVVLAAAVLFPLPSLRSTTFSTVVKPVPTAAELVCPGGLLRLGTSTGANANSATALGSPQIVSAASSGDILAKPFAISDAGTGNGPAAPRLLTTPPLAAGGTAPLVGGAQSQSLTTSEFAGLASAACAAPSGDVWLAGGATSVGRTTLLLLANPTAVDAIVSVQVFGETGPVTAPGMDGITVAAGSQRVLSIAGFAPGLVSPVVHVTSSGGQVLANLEQTTVRGLDPGGVDLVGPQAAPARSLVIPGVVVSGTKGIQSIIGQSGYEDLQSTLRLFVPGTKSAKVSITVLAENGTVTGKPTTTTVQPGTVNDLALDSLSDGNYTLLLTSSAPLVAGARVSTASSAATNPATDFAWATAAPLLSPGSVVSIADNLTATMHLENPTDAAETVHLRALAGTDLSVTVKAQSATSLAVPSGSSYVLEGFTGLYASVSGLTDGGVTSYSVYPSAAGVGSIRIYG